MPTYEYRCQNGHTFEVMQSMADDPIAICEICGEPVQRVFHPVAVHFKGSGFYSTDYGKKRGAADEGSSQEQSEKAAEKSEKSPEKSGKSGDTEKPSGGSDSSAGKDAGGSDKQTDSKND